MFTTIYSHTEDFGDTVKIQEFDGESSDHIAVIIKKRKSDTELCVLLPPEEIVKLRDKLDELT